MPCPTHAQELKRQPCPTYQAVAAVFRSVQHDQCFLPRNHLKPAPHLHHAGAGDGEAFRAAFSRAHFPFSAAQLLLKCAPCITQAEPSEEALRPLRPS